MKKYWYSEDFKIGILGGGQLGRMIIQAATDFNMSIYCLDNDKNAPCSSLAKSFTYGNIQTFDDVLNFGKDKDLISIEIENVNVEALFELEKLGKKVFPQARVIKLIQDKYLQKKFYLEQNIPTSEFLCFNSKEDILNYYNINEFSPIVQKLRKGGYDGKGVLVINSKEELQNCFDEASIVEQKVKILKEISVIVARNENGECVSYPSVECEFNVNANLVEFLFTPAEISNKLEDEAQKIALNIINKLNMVGLLAVEFFIDINGNILVNEIAPRPHNSGHHTIECSVTSQFEQMLRAINNLPLGNTRSIQNGIMLNLLGEEGFEGNAIYEGIEKIIDEENLHIHLYGKEKTKSFRKMGHITICGDNLNELKSKALMIKNIIKVKS